MSAILALAYDNSHEREPSNVSAKGCLVISFIANRVSALNGADLMSRDILRGLIASGLPLTVVSSDPREAVGDLGKCQDLLQWVPAPSCIANPSAGRLRWRGRLFSLLRNCLSRWRNGAQLERISSQGMVVNGFSNHWVFRFANPAAITPRVLIVHDSPQRFDLKGQPPLSWAIEKMSRYSHFIFCSQRVGCEWMKFGELTDKRHCSIPNCCREDDVRKVMTLEKAAVRKRLGLPASRFVVVCPATIQYRKGQDLLVDSIPVLQCAIPNLLLCMVGESLGDWGAALSKQIKETDHRLQFQLLGARRDALEFIYAADAMVLPARSEAAPLVVLEAMALKTPVIASAVGGVPEMVEHGHSGLLFAAENHYELVESLVTLANAPLQRIALSENASQRYWARFSRSQMSSRYAAALRYFVSDGQRKPAAGTLSNPRRIDSMNAR